MLFRQISLTVAACAIIGFSGYVSAFELMSEAEMETHQKMMQALKGQAREDYRNAQYQRLRARAEQGGYALPETPPWQTAEAQPTAPEAAKPAAAPDAKARHDEMSAQLKARADALKASQEPAPAAAPVPPRPVAPPPPVTAAAAMASETSPGQTPPTPATDVPAVPPAVQMPQPPVAPSVAEAPAGPAPVQVPEPPAMDASRPAKPTAPVRPAVPEFAEITVEAPKMPEITVEPPRVPEAPPRPAMPGKPAATVATDKAPEAPVPAQATPDPEAMAAYRTQMRERFDAYMAERQAMHEEQVRRQREQRDATMEQNRGRPWQPPRYQPQPPPPGYGPRYPSAYPGYRTPYWQQPGG